MADSSHTPPGGDRPSSPTSGVNPSDDAAMAKPSAPVRPRDVPSAPPAGASEALGAPYAPPASGTTARSARPVSGPRHRPIDGPTATGASVAEAVDAIERFLATSGPQPGSVIAQYLERELRFRPRAFGYASLTAFLQSAFEGRLSVVGEQGTDRVWQFAHYGPAPSALSHIGAQVWRALASPNSLRRVRVYAHTETGEWQIERLAFERKMLTDGQMTLLSPGMWRHISPLPATGHTKLAREFAARDDLGLMGEALRAVVRQEASDWWQIWRVLLPDHPVQQQAWLDYRDAGIRRYIERALQAAGLNAAAVRVALAELGGDAAHLSRALGSVFAATPAGATVPPREHAHGARAAEPSAATPTTLRQALHLVIDGLTDEELTRIQVPANAVALLLNATASPQRLSTAEPPTAAERHPPRR